MELPELLARLKDTENPIEDMDGFIAEVATSVSDALSVRDAKVSKTLEDLAATQAKIDKLKITNYDLMMKQPVDSTENSGNDASKPEPVSGIESLFED